MAGSVAGQIEIEAHYSAYLERQRADVAAFRRDEALALPADLDFDAIGGLSNEAREKLHAARPATLGAAGRISGVTPAALTALLGHVKRRVKHKQTRSEEHTSELQSRRNLVCRLLLEKKKITLSTTNTLS